MEIQFFVIHDGAPPVFHCERMRANITLKACIQCHKNHRDACKGCPIGEQHDNTVGIHALPSAHYASVFVNGNIRKNPARPDYFQCVRCKRKTPKIIAYGLCVSCFNRHAEVCKGVNAKGKYPHQIAANLNTITALVTGFVTGNIGMKTSKYAPTITRSTGGIKVKGIFSGIDELRRWLNLYHHGEEVVSFESCTLTGNKC
ncbi:MAG: hypothetical protein RIR79_2032 [Pseudomonadota bacterium]|jgi:hypothetical protein